MSSDERVQVAVCIPDEDVGKRKNAGTVVTLTFIGGKLSGSAQLWQGHGLPGKPARGDRLGAAITPMWSTAFAIGVPGKDANGRKDSGAVIVRSYKDPYSVPPGPGRSRVITQDTNRVPGTSERGDAFGSALEVACGLRKQEQCSIAVGAPGEDLAGHRDVGAVAYIDAWDYGPPWFTFGSQKVRGLSRGDRFGSRFAVAGRFGWDEDSYHLLVVGAPGEDRPGARNAGRYYAANLTFLAPAEVATPFANGVARNERFGGQPR